MKSLPVLKRVCSLAAAACLGASLVHAAQAGVLLTDSAVFSTNGAGENWNGMIWNTQGAPDQPWNLYYSSSADANNPVFINSQDNAGTSLNLDLGPGTHNFLIFGDSGGVTLDPLQHFVASFYFGGNQDAPDISGLYGPDCPVVCAAAHWNGLDLFGASGLGGNVNAQEAGTLIYSANGYQVELTAFTWAIDSAIDAVWPYWDDTAPYSTGNGQADFVGTVQLRVTAVSEPAALGLMTLALGLAAFASSRPRRPLRFS